MDKFSLYDFLGLLLPGVILVWMFDLLNKLYHALPFSLIPDDWNIAAGVLFCLALITGAMLYALSFWLVQKKWYRKLTGVYKSVADVYLEMGWAHQIMNGTLNDKARKWYNREIFFEEKYFDMLTHEAQKQSKNLQDEYYDRMYYELDYHGKMEQAKTFQSFYFFFRQLFSACLLVLLVAIILHLISLISSNAGLHQPQTAILVANGTGILLILFLSARLAGWYRKRMVVKMYWAYFSHLNQ